jgi:hypothetical protein
VAQLFKGSASHIPANRVFEFGDFTAINVKECDDLTFGIIGVVNMITHLLRPVFGRFLQHTHYRFIQVREPLELLALTTSI